MKRTAFGLALLILIGSADAAWRKYLYFEAEPAA